MVQISRVKRNRWIENRWIVWAVFSSIVALGTLLRFNLLERHSIWGDEACMVYLSQNSPGEILRALMSEDRPDVDVAPPLYFLALHFWQLLLGTSVSAFRSFSAIWGILAILAGILLARLLADNRTAIITGLLIAFNPFQIWYSQEIRMYSMATTLAAFSVLGFAGCLKNKSHAGYATIAVVFTAALLLTQYYGFLLLAAISLYFLYRMICEKDIRRKVITISLCLVSPVLIFSPWLTTLFLDFSQANHPGGFPSYFHPVKSLILLFIKYTVFGNETYILDQAVLIATACLFFAGISIKGFLGLKDTQRILGFVVILPILLVFSVSSFGLNVYKSHPFILFHIPFLVILGISIASFSNRMTWRVLAGAIGFNLIVLNTLNFNGEYLKPRVKEVSAWVDSQRSEGDQVAVLPAFLPNPVPIVGDLLAYRYYASDSADVLYLTGSGPDDIVETLIGHFPVDRQMYLVYQKNPAVQDALITIQNELGRTCHLITRKEFPSRIRDFSMGVDKYGPPLSDASSAAEMVE